MTPRIAIDKLFLRLQMFSLDLYPFSEGTKIVFTELFFLSLILWTHYSSASPLVRYMFVEFWVMEFVWERCLAFQTVITDL